MRISTRWVATLVAVVPCTVLAEDGAAAPLTAEVMWQIQRIGDPALAPDGRSAVYPATSYDDEKDQGETDLYLVLTAGGKSRRLTSMPGYESEPAWSPDGRWIAFVAKRGEDTESQLYVIPTDGGEAMRVGDVATGVSAPKWFPDSKRIAFISRVWRDLPDRQKAGERFMERGKSKMTAKTWSRPPVTWWDHWIDDRQAQVFSIPMSGGAPTAITPGSGFELSRRETNRDSFDIAPDGREIAFAADVDPTDVDFNSDILVVPADSGPAHNLTTDNVADDENPKYSPDGRWLLYTRQTIKWYGAVRDWLARHAPPDAR